MTLFLLLLGLVVGVLGDVASNATKPLFVNVTADLYCFPPTLIPRLEYSKILNDTTAQFLSLYFTYFNLPQDDYLTIRAINSSAQQTYIYTIDNVPIPPFFATPIFGQGLLLEVYSLGTIDCSSSMGFTVKNYRYSGTSNSVEADCTPTSNDLPPTCNKVPQLPYFRGSQAIARLLINAPKGAQWCTGSTTFDFRAYSPVCSTTACNTSGSCPGPLIIRGTECFCVQKQLFENGHSTYVGGMPIYIPQHPLGQGMVVGIKTPASVGYQIATLPGSSGSPIISTANAVVGMHSCGGNCKSGLNAGIPAPLIIKDLVRQNKLPLCAIAPALSFFNPPLPVFTALGTLFQRALGITMDVYKLNIDASNQVLELEVTSYQQSLVSNTFNDEPNLNIESEFQGSIRKLQNTTATSVLHIALTILAGSMVSIDVVSYQEFDNGTTISSAFTENGNCDATYFDAVLYLFQDTTSNNRKILDVKYLLAIVDDIPLHLINEDIAFGNSVRDPFLKLYLPPGKYVAVLGRYPLGVHDAVYLTAPTPLNDELLGPWKDGKVSNNGNVKVLFSTSVPDALVPPQDPIDASQDNCTLWLLLSCF
ncbi:hypothetical protein THRCLA_04973 [Thraustotheca clavata]|uniref:Secreted protein n=1 Tax=Thraustotheca clavata TaxID=74557 RepID=A0A1V9ZXB7_9STRA|nr:hypothetical protein THRCLA_04973 [Thraustotheca clavata]